MDFITKYSLHKIIFAQTFHAYFIEFAYIHFQIFVVQVIVWLLLFSFFILLIHSNLWVFINEIRNNYIWKLDERDIVIRNKTFYVITCTFYFFLVVWIELELEIIYDKMLEFYGSVEVDHIQWKEFKTPSDLLPYLNV